MSADRSHQKVDIRQADGCALAEDCIAVGSTHREAPHAFGVTWTSSKGPTLDGRLKPDVVPPGEWIASAASGAIRAKAGLDRPDEETSGVDETEKEDPLLTYAEESGTSMAAPITAGVAALVRSAAPNLTARAVAERIRTTAVPIGGPVPRRIDAAAALAIEHGQRIQPGQPRAPMAPHQAITHCFALDLRHQQNAVAGADPAAQAAPAQAVAAETLFLDGLQGVEVIRFRETEREPGMNDLCHLRPRASRRR